MLFTLIQSSLDLQPEAPSTFAGGIVLDHAMRFVKTGFLVFVSILQ